MPHVFGGGTAAEALGCDHIQRCWRNPTGVQLVYSTLIAPEGGTKSAKEEAGS